MDNQSCSDISNRIKEGRMEIFSKPVRNLWNNWDIRVFILSSLLLQILLIFFASLRKRMVSKLLILFTWSLYLLTDWVAIFTLGLLSNSQGDESSCDGSNCKLSVKTMDSSNGSKYNIEKSTNNDILAFWAPFLLLHLGGPDTITAFSMEDNELWLRHLFGVIFQVSMAGYVFILSLPMNTLLLPTLLMFVAGIIKYSERTYALYLASMNQFQESMLESPDPDPNYANLMGTYQSMKDAGLPVDIIFSPDPLTLELELNHEHLDEASMVMKAYHFFKTFKGLIVEQIFSIRHRAESRNDFLRWSPMDAFRVIEYELEFIYDVLFTKAAVVHNITGYILRVVCSCSIVVAFLLFFFTNKRDFLPLDITISYTLLGGAIALDFMAFIMLLLSYWNVFNLKVSVLGNILHKIIHIVRPYNRWSGSIMQYNLIDTCIPKHEKYLGRIANRPTFAGKLSEAFYIQKALDNLPFKMLDDFLMDMQYTHRLTVSKELKMFIFDELKKKSEIMKEPSAARSLSSCRGNWTLEQRGYLSQFGDTIQIEFDESLLLWHLATTFCYYTDENIGTIPRKDYYDNIKNEAVPTLASMHRLLSKIISDYMIYLLIMKPSMMSSTTVIGQVMFRDTRTKVKASLAEVKASLAETMKGNIKTRYRWYPNLASLAEAMEVIRHKLVTRSVPNLASAIACSSQNVEDETERQRELLCTHLLSINTEVRPVDVKGGQSKSVLFDACILAKKLKDELRVGPRWSLISEMWVEMLSYAASKCSGIAHAQQLSKGGEFLTFIWFLTVHLGLGEHYRIDAGNPRAKLIVGK